MARKKGRVPSPTPTPPREESSSDDEEAEATPATQKAPQNPNPPSTVSADADSSDGDEEESEDSETDASAFQLRRVARSPGKLEEDGSSSDSPQPAPLQKAEAGKKRQAAESISSSGGKAKKAKADVEEKAAVPLLLPGKAKAKAGAEKKALPSELNASTNGKSKKKHKEKAVTHHSASKPAARQRWTTEDEIKVLEALVNHIKANGTQPSAAHLISAVGDSLERKNCGYTEMYEKVRNLKQRYEKAASSGTLPGNEDDLRKFNLSKAAWGESAKEFAAAPISQNEAASSKSNKGQANKEKKLANKEKKGDAAKEATSTVNVYVGTSSQSDKGQATKEKLDGDTKGRLAKKDASTDTPAKSKKRASHKEELEDDAKTDTTKETTNTATQNVSTLVGRKSGKSDKEKNVGDAETLGPKETAAVTQNDDTRMGETHEEEKMDSDSDVKNLRKGFNELHNLYPNLTSYVENIQAQHPCGETLKRAFEFIADEKACGLEAKIKKQRVAEMKMEVRRAETKKEVTNIFIGLLD